MSVVLRCGTIVPGCAVVLHGKSEDDILIAAVDHLKTAHGLDHLSIDLRQKLKAAMESEEPVQRAPRTA
jgi:predicted small metal-binding protein